MNDVTDAEIEAAALVINPTAFDPLAGHEQGKCPDCDAAREDARNVARAALTAAALACKPVGDDGLREAFRAGYWAWAGPANKEEHDDAVKQEAEAWAEWSVAPNNITVIASKD